MFKFDDRGLIPAIVQDAGTGRVLTLAYMNEEALKRTLKGPDAWFYSRSRGQLWHKGETSGNYLKVVEVRPDCDGDAVLVRARPTGPACHTGEETCFHSDPIVEVGESEARLGPGVLAKLWDVVQARKRDMPEGSYTAKLLREGTPRVAQKVVEEAGEVALAAALKPHEDLPNEAADLLYHLVVLLASTDVSPDEVWRVLEQRAK